MRTIVLGFSLMALATPVWAQTAPDPRWSAWLGCWDLVTDAVRENLPSAEAALEPSRASKQTNSRGARVCVAPAPGGVVLSTLIGAQPVLEQTVIADGSDRPISEPECKGTQRAEWSKDGLRLFSNAELRCPNQAPRTVSGLALLVANGSWLDVQSVTINSRSSVRIRRYRRAADQPNAAARSLAATRLTLDDVKEAATKVSAQALEAALIETNSTFGLTGKALLDLDKAGVPDSVVDLMVALTFPQAFTVERASRDDRVTPFDAYPFSGGWAPGYPLWPYGYGSYFGYGFSDYYWSPYYYSPFGYSYLGSYPPYYGSPIVIVDPSPPGTGAPPSGPGRVVNGLGYTRIAPRDASGDAASASSGGSSRSGGGARVTSQGFTSGDSSSGSGSSSSGSSSGGSSGSSSGDGGGGRTAVDR